MTPNQVDLIRSSFAKVLFRREEAGAIFYQRLFTVAPDLRPMFKGDIVLQGRKLIDTLAIAVGALRDTDSLSRTLRELGRRHVGYGITPSDYRPVGESLIWTLETLLGPSFDPEARTAWIELYRFVTSEMQAPDTRSAAA